VALLLSQATFYYDFSPDLKADFSAKKESNLSSLFLTRIFAKVFQHDAVIE